MHGDIFLRTLTHKHIHAGWSARNNIDQLGVDIGCCLEDLPKVIADHGDDDDLQQFPLTVTPYFLIRAPTIAFPIENKFSS